MTAELGRSIYGDSLLLVCHCGSTLHEKGNLLFDCPSAVIVLIDQFPKQFQYIT